MSRDILAEFMSWTPLASHAATVWLRDHDLPHDVERLAEAIYGLPGPFGIDHASIELVVGAAPGRPVGKTLFEIDDAGRWAVLQPVEDEGGDVVDLIAWHPAEPQRWRFLEGVGEALGLITRDHRLPDEGPVICYETPRSWLHAGGRGLCLLGEDWATAQRILLGESQVGAENADLGRRIDRCLRYRPAPQILIVEYST